MSISVHLVSLGWPVCELAATGSPLPQGSCIQGDWTTSLQGLEAGQFSLEEVRVLAGFHVRQTLQLWGKQQTKGLLLRVYGKTWWLRDAGHWERQGAEQLLDTRGSVHVSFLPAETSQPQPMRTGDLPRFPSNLGFSWHEHTHLKALLVSWEPLMSAWFSLTLLDVSTKKRWGLLWSDTEPWSWVGRTKVA